MNTSPSTFHLSFGEYGFKEVIEDFPNAKNIYIVTYNISPKGNNLIGELQKVPTNSSVTVIANIPDRYSTYFVPSKRGSRKTPKEKARELIDLYKSTLDASSFSCTFTSYFNFDSHAKIIMTDNVAYVGSANFSDDSKDKYEAGFIIRDKGQILAIKNEIERVLIPGSYRYSTSFWVIFLQHAIEWMKALRENLLDIEQGLFTDTEVSYLKEERLFDYYNAYLSKSVLNQMKEIYIECEEVCEVIIGMGGGISSKNIKRLLNMYEQQMDDFTDYMEDLTEISSDDFVSSRMQELPEFNTGDPDDLERAVEIACEEEFERRSEITEGLSPAFIDRKLKRMPLLLGYIIEEVNKSSHILKSKLIYENEDIIDNTR